MSAGTRRLAGCLLSFALLCAACREQWQTRPRGPGDAEAERAFFAGLNNVELPALAEPERLRPCCIFANDVGVRVGKLEIPGYEVSNVLGVDELGEHVYNHGAVILQRPQPAEGRRLVSDEASGILYTCRGGFIDLAHVRDNADRTLFLASRIARMPATGGTFELAAEGGARSVVVRPLDPGLVRRYGLREVVTRLAEWLDFQASIWHEIATWYGWSSTRFSERPSAFSPEDLYSNLLGTKLAGELVRRQGAGSEEEYDRNLTALLGDALAKLGPLPREASRFAFEYVDGIWWDSNEQVPDNALVRHRNFELGPTLQPWKLVDAQPSDTLLAARREYAQHCGGDWQALALRAPERMGGVPFRKMGTFAVRPDPALLEQGLALPAASDGLLTQADFPAVIAAIRRAADAELGPGAGLPVARPGESSRLRAEPPSEGGPPPQ